MEFLFEKVDIEKKEVLENMAEFYQYDFNIYYSDDLNSKGRFGFINTNKYIDNDKNEAWFIKVENKYAGFVLISSDTYQIKEGKCIEELWIMPKYRNGMFAIKVIKELFEKLQGKLEFIVMKQNERWLKVLEYIAKKNYKIEVKTDVKRFGKDFTLFVVDYRS